MKINIRAFAGFREILGREISLEIEEGSNVSDLIERLCRIKPGFRDAVFSETGELRDYVIIMLNRRRLDMPEDLNSPLSDNDEVAIFPPVAGG
ncbi:MAG: MoaD/ThiS family protein [Methanothrix sp.]|uniref:ubiquitin-like small modifier protein 1 n=1 Tax=Methanothrix sp. TaxID=90426 RepID=UPI0025EF2AB8|nr:ubiquitin-like small modifier protein 1 [Methanothrix sp.]MCQ8902664.1 MoaD/ThiS family protein [Methanothrix sp.]